MLRENESINRIPNQEAFFTAGTTGRTGLLNDHQDDAAVLEFDSQAAPALIQSRSAPISAGESGRFPGGISAPLRPHCLVE